MKRLILYCLLLLTTLLFAQEFTYHVPDAVAYEVPYQFNDSFYKKGFHEEMFFFQYQLEDSSLNVNQFSMNSSLEFSELTTIATIPITTEISSLDALYSYFRWFPDGSFHLILSSLDKGYVGGEDHGQFLSEDFLEQQFFLEYALRFLNTGELFDTVNINDLYPGFYYRTSSNFRELVIASMDYDHETSRVFFQNYVYSIDTQNLEFWVNSCHATPLIINGYYVKMYDIYNYYIEIDHYLYKVYNDEFELLYTHYDEYGYTELGVYIPIEIIDYCSDLPIMSTQCIAIGSVPTLSVYQIDNNYSISFLSVEADDFTIINQGVFVRFWFEYGNGMRLGISRYNVDINEWNTDSIASPPWHKCFYSNEHIISYPLNSQEPMAIFDTDFNMVAFFEERFGGLENVNWFRKVNFFEKFGYYSAQDNAYILTELEITVSNDDAELIPSVISLENYPNPFNPETTIAFSTKESGQVSLDIYNIKGQKVRTLLNDHKDSGNHTVVWNGKDDSGKSVASGVFFYRMKSGKYSSTKKMILMK